MRQLNFTVKKLSGEEEMTAFCENLLVIGYAGRNLEKTQEHIKELEEQLGVPAPKKIPTIFECSGEILTQEKNVKFLGNKTSGEVEFIIIPEKDRICIGLGSDHTDRELEGSNVPKAKQVCPKPIGQEVWIYEEIKDHWDQIKLLSFQTVNGMEISYQNGTLAEILPVEKIVKELQERVGTLENSIIYSGTVPLIKGFVYGEKFRCMMVDEVLNRKMELSYCINVISEEER